MNEDLNKQFDNAQAEFERNSTAENYNHLKRVTKVLAHKLLVDKARQGSTMAIIELAKRNPLQPGLHDDISQYDEVSLEYLEARDKVTCNKYNVQDATTAIELWKEQKVSDAECERMLALFAKRQQIELAEKGVQNNAQVFLNVSKEIIDAI